MSFTLDDFKRSLPLLLVSCTPQAQQLDEHQNLLQWRAQLVGDVGEKALSRIDEADLAAQRGEAGYGENDAAREEQQSAREVGLRNSSRDEKTSYVWPEVHVECGPADEAKRGYAVQIGRPSIVRRLKKRPALIVDNRQNEQRVGWHSAGPLAAHLFRRRGNRWRWSRGSPRGSQPGSRPFLR